jgi:hypothetical protein
MHITNELITQLTPEEIKFYFYLTMCLSLKFCVRSFVLNRMFENHDETYRYLGHMFSNKRQIEDRLVEFLTNHPNHPIFQPLHHYYQTIHISHTSTFDMFLNILNSITIQVNSNSYSLINLFPNSIK